MFKEIFCGLVVRISGFSCCGPGSITGQQTVIQQAMWHGQFFFFNVYYGIYFYLLYYYSMNLINLPKKSKHDEAKCTMSFQQEYIATLFI